MNIIEEYINLKNIQLRYSKQKIPLENGWILLEENNSTIYRFEIDLDLFNKINSLNGDYSIEIENKNYSCEIINLNPNQIDIKIDSYNKEIIFGNFMIDLSHIHKKQLYALKQFQKEDHRVKSDKIFGEIGFEGGESLECIYDTNTVNEQQKNAISYAIGVKDFFLIWGPPGTGKTSIVPHIVLNYQNIQKKDVKSSNKILICSWTNTAVDNVAKTLHKANCKIVRYGNRTTLNNTEYEDIIFDKIRKRRMKIIHREYVDIQQKIIKIINENKNLILSNKKNIENLEEEKSLIDFEMSKIGIDAKKLIKNVLENEILILQDSTKEYDKIINEFNNQIPYLETIILNYSNIITQNNNIYEKLNEKIKTLEDEILEQFDTQNNAKAYLKFIDEHPIKYQFYKHIQFLAPNFHKDLLNKKLNKKNRAELILYINEVEVQISKIHEKKKECNNKRINTKKAIEIARERLSDYINQKNELKKQISNILIESKKENEELTKLISTFSSLESLDICGFLKDEILKNIVEKLDINGEIQILIKKNKLLQEQLKEIQLDVFEKEKQIIEYENELIGLNKEIDEKIKDIEIEILKEYPIIATTNMEASKLFELVEFDLTIMDEAGGIDFPGALIPILSSQKIVFLGDHKQLAPIIEESDKIEQFFKESGKKELRKKLKLSIFELLFEKAKNQDNCLIKLKKQYRMREEISNFISDRFYDGELESEHDFNYELDIIDSDLLGCKAPFVCLIREFFSKKEGKSWKSESEMMLIKNIVDGFKEAYGNDILKKIGIISPYNAQSKLIKKELGINCSTVHNYQGQERQIIILSTVRYSPGFLGGNDGERLLNVAISRAKEKLIIIGRKEIFRNIPYYSDLYKYIVKGNGKIVPEDEETKFDPIIKCKQCGDNLLDSKYELCYDCNDINELDKAKGTTPEFDCEDEHKVRSTHEKIIDDWLYQHAVEHEYEKKLPFNSYCDWYLKNNDLYIEYFGYDSMKNNQKRIKTKIRRYKKHNLKIIDLYQKDIKNIDEILSERLRRFGVLFN